MSRPAYAEAAEELRDNTEQWSAYESQGNCVVLAGPGAGKTKTITIKIARLLAEEVRPPRRLACITYSNACVGELLSRLRKLGVADENRLRLATVHSFCLTELVLPFSRMAGIAVADPLVVASSAQSRILFAQAYVETLGGASPKDWFRKECEKLRRTVVDRGSKEWKNSELREIAVVEAYEALLLEKGFLDFDGIVLAGLQLIEEHEWVRRCVRAKYPIIVIDEYQDLGLPLHRMVLALIKAGVRIVAVGDPDQSIYGFTGAKPGLLRTLETYPTVIALRLKLNYRCADQIIAASRALLPDPAEFKSHDGRQGTIVIYQLECDVRGQADYALGKIVPALLAENKNWKLGDIAVLYRSFNEGEASAAAADDLELKYFRLDNGSPIKRSRLTEWLTDCAKWCSSGWQSGAVSLGDLLRDWRTIRRSLTREADMLAARARLISCLFAHRDGSIPLHKWLLAIGSAAVDELLAEEPGLGDESDTFQDLLNASKKGGVLGAYTVEIFGNQGKSPDQINLMTLHSSKGLEFQAVIMIGLEEGEIPSKYAHTEEEQQEAARLFYVGVTRAKSSVHLMYGFNESPLITKIRSAT